MFTIEVEPKGKDQEFSFRHLEMYHKECYGGKINIISTTEDFGHPNTGFEDLDFYKLTCTRCGLKTIIKEQSEVPSQIIKTAIDGQKRDVNGFKLQEKSHDIGPSDAVDITLIRKS